MNDKADVFSTSLSSYYKCINPTNILSNTSQGVDIIKSVKQIMKNKKGLSTERP